MMYYDLYTYSDQRTVEAISKFLEIYGGAFRGTYELEVAGSWVDLSPSEYIEHFVGNHDFGPMYLDGEPPTAVFFAADGGIIFYVATRDESKVPELLARLHERMSGLASYATGECPPEETYGEFLQVANCSLPGWSVRRD